MRPPLDSPRPIAAADEVWIERMTWMEIRDALRAGRTTIIIPAGGVEQNGPYVVTGKHNVIVHATAEAIARKLGNALVAPVVPFIPEGSIDPPGSHMLYPGTISVTKATFAALTGDIANSFRVHGFRNILLIGDSGSSQKTLAKVADDLDQKWRATGTRVRFIPEYYDWPGRQKWLAAQGYHEVEQGYHDELSVEAIMLGVDPTTVRMRERIAAKRFAINGVELAPAVRTVAVGRALVDHIAEITAQAVRQQEAH